MNNHKKEQEEDNKVNGLMLLFSIIGIANVIIAMFNTNHHAVIGWLIVSVIFTLKLGNGWS